MPKYRVPFRGLIEVEAENILQAIDAVKDIKVVGLHVGGKCLPHNRDPITRRVTLEEFEKDLPEKI